ncbi:MAG: HEPN domain-containing protein [Deltaproteobacteria bacterium]|mgnify:CR=1 FL=1|nr:HEPN domain-containing protein [Deltaproteobacteria bacterium]MBW2077702.1 HEPN domain-containing protein [Deltaproteobacteria bacterium]MBW2310289.1 HEPN domain-containing protein [Deltaproteobacteria bacterium]
MTEKANDDKAHKDALIRYWMEKARESIEAAQSEYDSGRYATAVRDLYYACFYALTAVLLKEGHSFKKHTSVKAALHKDLIRTGIVQPEWGKFYNKIFDSRHEGDYQPLRVFEAEEVKMFLDQGAGFIANMEEILAK